MSCKDFEMSNGAIPDFSKGKQVTSFEVGGRRCDLLAECPVAGAEFIPEGSKFHYPYSLLIIDPESKKLEGVLNHEVSMFGTEAISWIDMDGNRETLALVGNSTSPQLFLRSGLSLLVENNKIFSKEQIEPVVRSVPWRKNIDDSKKSFFQRLLIKRELKSLMKKVDHLEGYVGNYIHVCHQLSVNSLDLLNQWDVTNPILSAYLDYVYGVATYGCRAVLPDEEFQDVVLNAFMARVIGSQFAQLPLAEFCVEYLASQTFDFISTKGSELSMPVFPMNFTVEDSKPIWAERMVLGSKDFQDFSSGKSGAFPAGLFELKLIRGSDVNK
jgi:hypothetical protein